MRKVLILSALAACTLALAACGDRVAYVDHSYPAASAAEVMPVVTAPIAAPVVVAQPDPSTSILTGMMLGHALSGGYHGGGYHHTTIINRTTYVRPTYFRPAIYRPSVYRSSSFGRGFRGR